jgi:hypothetical protein
MDGRHRETAAWPNSSYTRPARAGVSDAGRARPWSSGGRHRRPRPEATAENRLYRSSASTPRVVLVVCIDRVTFALAERHPFLRPVVELDAHFRLPLHKEAELPLAADTATGCDGTLPYFIALPFCLPRAAADHSMTRSARSSNDRGIVTPSSLAALRLITNSNFVGCSTGRSASLAPFRIFRLPR